MINIISYKDLEQKADEITRKGEIGEYSIFLDFQFTEIIPSAGSGYRKSKKVTNQPYPLFPHEWDLLQEVARRADFIPRVHLIKPNYRALFNYKDCKKYFEFNVEILAEPH